MVLGRTLGAVGLIALAVGGMSLCTLDSLADDFQVNTYTTDSQVVPAVSMDPAGNVVVTWVSYGSSGNDQSFTSIQARLFGPTGAPFGDDFQVNTYTYNMQSWPGVARGPAGDFVVVWDSLAVAHPNTSIQGQRYGPAGSPLGGEFTANSTSPSPEYPVVAMDSSENFVVVWGGARGRLFSADGTPLGPEFQAGAPPPLEYDRWTSVAMAPSGEFVLAWLREGFSGGNESIHVRRYISDGTPAGPEFQANTSPVFEQPSGVAVAPDGSFVVVWTAWGLGSDRDVVGRRFAMDGTPLTGEFPVNTYTTNSQDSPAISMNANGEFMVVWMNDSGSGGGNPDFDINARRFAADATPISPEFQVNTVTSDWQISPAVVYGTDGRFVVVWRSDALVGGDGSFSSIQASGISDLQVAVDDGVGQVYPTGSVTYTIAVTNPVGTGRVTGARVQDAFPSALSCTWTCAHSAGATCTAGPVAGDVDDTITLPLGGIATYTASCTVSPSASGTIVNTATVTPPLNVSDFFSGNNTATDVDTVVDALLVGDVSVPEGNVGTTTALFTVSLTGPMAAPVTVDYATADGTATVLDNDYVPASGTLTFAPGETAQPIPVGVIGDTTFEADEKYTLTLTNATAGVLIGNGVGVGTILNDDAAQASGSLDELVHGSIETRSLETQPGPTAIAQQWRLRQAPNASYETVVDSETGDLGPQGPALDRLASDGSVIQSAAAVSGGSSRSLRWENGNVELVDERIRVQSRGCITDCDAADTFRIRLFETTLHGARFNNSATQVTVVVVQNASGDVVSGHVDFRSGAGLLLHSEPFALQGKQVLVLGPSGIPAIQGQAGSVSVSHDGRHGALVGKTVAVEPATGFAFDTPLEPRRR